MAIKGFPGAVAAADKVDPDPDADGEHPDAPACYDGDAAIDTHNPLFESTPPELLALHTNRGHLDPGEVRAVASDHAALADWLADT